jgi:hypothetical protein
MGIILQDQAGNSYNLTVNETDQSLSLVPVAPQTPSAPAGAVQFTGLDIINRAGRAAHILASGEQFVFADANDALMMANGMLDSWNAQRNLIFVIQRQVFNLVSGQQTYQFGPGGADFNTARPPRIDGYGVISLANPQQPLELPLGSATFQQWQAVPVKGITGALPTMVWDDNSFPFRNINLWPIPNVSTLQIAFYTWTQLNFLAIANSYSFPPGYYEALVYNLAVRMAIEWPGELTPQLTAAAGQALATIKTMNAPIIDLKCDPALNSPALRAYNWISDTPVNY